MMAFFRSFFAPPRHLILLVAALWIGLALAEKRSDRHKVSKETLTNIIYYSLFGYIIAGRLLYAAAHLSAFIQSPLSLFSLSLDLFDPLAGLAAGLLVGWIYGSRQKLPFWPALDALTPLFATLAVGIALSHLAAGTAFGSPTSLPWGIELWNATRHPSQMYELIAALVIFGWIWFRKADSRPGLLFLTFTALTAAARLWLEAFRGDSTLIFTGLRLAQVIAWMVLAAALVVSEVLRRPTEAN
jgi:phosphatidylglycerol:prolipoprotein diacylglycerol transferase